jgi:hypothetical protein
MKAHIPRTFRTGAIVDSEDVNANLQAISRSITRNVGQRYTYCPISVDITGVVDTDTAAERTIPFCRPRIGATPLPLDIVGVELSIFATAGATWTLTATDENGTVFTLATATAGTTTEGYNASNVPLQLDSATRLDFVLSASVGSTITRGTVTLHVRADRNSQGTGAVPASYSPTLIDASTSTAATAINAEITAAAAARTVDQLRQLDVRGCCLVANDLTAAQTWRLPSGAGSVALCMLIAAVGTAARSAAASDGTNTATANTTGTSNIVDAANVSGPIGQNDDPTDTADDLVITLTPTGGAISRVFVFLWWS